MRSIDEITEVNKNINEIEHIEKFNPYHDSRGRFTSGGGGVSVSSGQTAAVSNFKEKKHDISGTGSVNGDKNARKKMLKDMNDAPVGATMEIKGHYTTGAKNARSYTYTKVESNGAGVNSNGLWQGAGETLTGTAIATSHIKNIMSQPGMAGKMTIKKNIDEIEHVEKFNPFHDSRGRFSNSHGFASYSADPNTKAGAMAIARSAAAGHGKTVNVHRQSQGETIRRNANWLARGNEKTQGYSGLRSLVEPNQGLKGASNAGARWQSQNQAAGRTTTGGKKPAPQKQPAQKPQAQQQAAQAKPTKQTTQKPQDTTQQSTPTGTKNVKQTMRSGIKMDADFDQSTVAGAKNKEYRGAAQGKDLTDSFDVNFISVTDTYCGQARYSNAAADMQGFNSPAKKVSQAEFTKLSQKYGDEFYRTVGSATIDGKRVTAKGMKDAYTKSNDLNMNGTSGRVYGDGIYTVSSKMIAGRGKTYTAMDARSADLHSKNYGDGRTTLKMTWASKPNIVTQRKLDSEWNKLTTTERAQFGNHKNTYAIAKGYDALFTSAGSYMTVFNRSKLAVLDD